MTSDLLMPTRSSTMRLMSDMASSTDLRGGVRDPTRARRRRRALGADGRARAAARPEALHRPPHGPARTRAPTCSRSACASSRRPASSARRKLPPPAASQVYELTAWGAALEPVLMELGRWGARAPRRRTRAVMSLDSHILSLQHAVRPRAAPAASTAQLRAAPRRADASAPTSRDGRLEVDRGEPPRPTRRSRGRPGHAARRPPRPPRARRRARRRRPALSRATRRPSPASSALFPLPEPAAVAA